mmetsp:Transcript_23467/g.45826  ORF Transcript_23467/g.45826 Transcript_23467/m.45826 type:complete len:605 (+) Transcript_23467:45-1859(+)
MADYSSQQEKELESLQATDQDGIRDLSRIPNSSNLPSKTTDSNPSMFSEETKADDAPIPSPGTRYQTSALASSDGYNASLNSHISSQTNATNSIGREAVHLRTNSMEETSLLRQGASSTYRLRQDSPIDEHSTYSPKFGDRPLSENKYTINIDRDSRSIGTARSPISEERSSSPSPMLRPTLGKIPPKVPAPMVDQVRSGATNVKVESHILFTAAKMDLERGLRNQSSQRSNRYVQAGSRNYSPAPSSSTLQLSRFSDSKDRKQQQRRRSDEKTRPQTESTSTHEHSVSRYAPGDSKRLRALHARIHTVPTRGEMEWMSEQMLYGHRQVVSKAAENVLQKNTTGDQMIPYTVTEIPGMGMYQHFKNDVMISYSRKNKPFVKKLVAKLTEFGIDPWVDWNDIPPGTDWRRQIEMGIQQAYAVIAVISPPFTESPVCRDEIDIATQHGKMLVPVVYEPVEYEDVWPELARVNWIFMREKDEELDREDEFDVGLVRLLQALHLDFDYVQRHAELCRKALEYKDSKSKDLLLRGDALKMAKNFLVEGATRHPSPILEQIEFINESRATRKAQKRCRRATFFVAILFAVAIAAATPILIFTQLRQCDGI